MGDSCCNENSECCTKGDDLRTISLDFGQVPIDTTVVKAVKIRNDNRNEESYEVQRDPVTNPLDIAFHFDKHSWSLESNCSVICQVRYRPILPFQKSIDYFNIVNGGNVVLKIIVQGRSIGPKAVICNNDDKLVMVCAPGENFGKRIKIVNDSDASANFIFDVDERQNSFKPEPTDGCIGPHSHTYIVITFEPAFEGPHIFYLPCLIQHQAPIMILLYGYCGKRYTGDNIPTLIYPQGENDGFRTYMSDSNHFRPERANMSTADPISLSNIHLDFGTTVPGSLNSIVRSPLTTCFKNHSEMDMMVKWHKDIDGIFSIKPNKARVGAGETCLFEVRFDPDEENEFYTREITAFAFWVKRHHSVPVSSYSMIASIRLMGHTFAPDSSSWIPQYQVPQTVIMPPCLPSSSVYTTFIIRKFGHLPLMFRFMPPNETHFSVKPMLGIIHKNYQVIVVEMFPEGHSKLLYERWSIIFNGNPEYEISLDFRGYAEYPCLSFSTEVITFFPTHPGCEQVQRVAMRNPTRHRITYWFDDSTSVLSVDRVRGHINSNEIIIHNWSFCPPEEGDYEFYVNCFTTATTIRRDICKIIEFQLRVLGKSLPGHLLATPNVLNFGEQVCDEVGSLSFQLINPGPVEIPYELTLKHHNRPLEEKLMNRITINPTSGILGPVKNEKIQVSISPREPGLDELSIWYSIRRNSQMDRLLPTKDPLEICRIKYFCYLPVIKIEDLLQHRTEPNMSKYVLWRLLNINKLNKMLKDMQPGDSSDLEMSIPPTILQDEKSIIKLLISNPTPAVATWSLKETKRCSFKRSSEKRGALKFNCPKYNSSERSLCTIHPKSGSLKAREKATITMEVRRSTSGERKLQWDLDVGYDRRIRVCMKLIGLSEFEKSAITLYGPHIEFKKIYIGDRDPVNQICWIYNPTEQNIAYSVDTIAFQKVNENHNDCEIFSCLNPSGTIDALSHEPILINFRPRRWGVLEVRISHSGFSMNGGSVHGGIIFAAAFHFAIFLDYQVLVPLMLGTERTAITIKGESANDPFIKISQEISPLRNILCSPEIPVYFNTDRVTLQPTPTHNRITRMFMVHNRSETEMIAYKWKRYELTGIIEIDVEPKTARIQPGKLQTHRLIILVGGKPCKINTDITCEFINQSKKRAYRKSVHVRDSLYEETIHHFTITEKGMTVPTKPATTVLEEPKPFYKTLTVRSYIYSRQDEESKTRRKERISNVPPLEISMERRSDRLSATNETIAFSKFTLEGMIWEILQSTNLETILNSDVKYSQIATSPVQRERIKERSYAKPSGRMIERILENMIFMIVHQEFALDVSHLTQTSDARQVSYQKMWQKVPRRKSATGVEARFALTPQS